MSLIHLSLGHEYARSQNITDVLFHRKETHNAKLPFRNGAKLQPFGWRAELFQQRQRVQ